MTSFFFCRGWSDLNISQTGTEWHVDCSDMVEMETICRIPIWRTFGRIPWHVVPDPRITLQGVRILSAILKIVLRHIFLFFFKMQFGFWRAAAFVSSPIHLLHTPYMCVMRRRHSDRRVLTTHRFCRALSVCVDEVSAWMTSNRQLQLNHAKTQVLRFSSSRPSAQTFHPLVDNIRSDVKSIFQDGGRGCSILFPVSYLLTSLPSEVKIYEQTKFRRHSAIHGWDITTCGLEKQRPPYWNSTSGFVFDHFTIMCILFRIRQPNFIQIGPPTVEIKSSYRF